MFALHCVLPLTLYNQVNEEISRLLTAIKTSLSGEGEAEASPDIIAQVANEVYAQDLLSLMVTNLSKFDFEVSFAWEN
jgi:calcium binding protein 39